MPHANIKRFTQREQVQSFVFRYGEMCARSFWLEEKDCKRRLYDSLAMKMGVLFDRRQSTWISINFSLAKWHLSIFRWMDIFRSVNSTFQKRQFQWDWLDTEQSIGLNRCEKKPVTRRKKNLKVGYRSNDLAHLEAVMNNRLSNLTETHK